jgi:transmembrane sensor
MKPGMNSEQIEAAAAAWFAKREGGAWNAADQAQLHEWIDSSTAHRIAFIRLTTAWERSGRLKVLGAGVSQGTIPNRDSWGFASVSSGSPTDIPGVRTMRQSRFPPRILAIAVLLVAATAAGMIWHFSTNRANSYSTAIGAVATVPLSDGSKVTLNTDSQIHVALDSTARRIELDHGEAFFEVSKDFARPFVVEIADKRVVAVGTKFSIRRDGNDIRVLVADGRVRIERRGASDKEAVAQVAAGSEARTAQTAILIDQLTPAQVEQLLSWRTGYIVFRDTSLADAVADFNRYNVRKIAIQDPAIAGIRIGGNFRSNDADAFLWLLQSGFPINVERRSDLIILTKR